MRYIVIASLMVGCAAASAQDLKTEITVDRDVQPALCDTRRPAGVSPRLQMPEVTPKALKPAEYTAAGPVTPDLDRLPPALWADSVEREPWRGYAAAGYLPLYNLGAVAGYRFIDRADLCAGAWMQYNGESYNGDIPDFDSALFTSHYLTAGAGLTWRPDAVSTLEAQLTGTLSSVRHPFYVLDGDIERRRHYNQGATDLQALAGWSTRTADVVWNAGAKAGYFNFGDDVSAYVDHLYVPSDQTWVSVSGEAGLCDRGGEVPWIGAEADWTFMSAINLPVATNAWLPLTGRATMTEGHIRPYVRFGPGLVEGRVGLNISLPTGKDAGGVKIAPEVTVNVTPADWIKIYGKATGGEKFNKLADLYAINPYMTPYYSYGRTNTALDIRAGAEFTPGYGLTMGFEGGYAIVKNRLTPLIYIEAAGNMQSLFETIDVNSWYAGAHASYTWRNLFTVSLSARAGGSDSDFCTWHEWDDGARWVVGAAVCANPTGKLGLKLAYALRTDRHVKSRIFSTVSDVSGGVPRLGDVSDLSLQADYELTPRLTAFASVSNLLCQRHLLISGMPSASVNGLLGVSCKF